MHALNITNSEWMAAKHYFATNPGATKMNKKMNGCAHSFVNIHGRIVAVGFKLGAGTFGLVKMAEDCSGRNYAIKVEGGTINLDDTLEEQILQRMGYSFGMVDRTLDQFKTFLPHIPSGTFYDNHKKYKLLELLEGNDLFFELYDKKAYEQLKILVPLNKLDDRQKLSIALLCCQQLMKLQALRIIHGDIKAENIKVKIQDDGNITLRFMDFGFSRMLPQGSRFVVDTNICNLPNYMAPEVLRQCTFSFESDIYSLGVMFRDHLGLNSNIYDGMLNYNPLMRDTLEITIYKLFSQLESINNSDGKILNDSNDVVVYSPGYSMDVEQTPQPVQPLLIERPPAILFTPLFTQQVQHCQVPLLYRQAEESFRLI